MGTERHQTSDMVRALNMYGVYNFSQLEELQDQVGSQVSAFNNVRHENAKRQRGPEIGGYAHPMNHQGAFQAVYPGHPSHSTQDEYDDDEKDDGQIDLMLDERPRADQPRTYRDPEKRREQNRRASQRARQRTRQREEQVVMLQQQLHLMASEMTTMQVQLSEAKHDVKREKVLSTIRANRELEATATNPEARSYSFSHPPLRIENRQRIQQHQQQQ
jgi:FtsZ-interacting cell division protein ZipA